MDQPTLMTSILGVDDTIESLRAWQGMCRRTFSALLVAASMAFLEARERPAPVGPANPHAAMMQAVFKITGPQGSSRAARGKDVTTVGTGFLVERPSAIGKDYIAVTAAHVLRQISGNHATFTIPMTRPDGTQQRIFLPVTIRDKGGERWTELRDADVAVMHVNLPATGVKPIRLDRLATDEDVERTLQLGVGDVVHTVTYPFGYDFNQFPVVRNVTLASHPVAPARVVKRLVVDFAAFGGDSGGPLYTHSNGPGTAGAEARILGIVTHQVLSPDGTQNTGLALVTPAVFIREAIRLLPPR